MSKLPLDIDALLAFHRANFGDATMRVLTIDEHLRQLRRDLATLKAQRADVVDELKQLRDERSTDQRRVDHLRTEKAELGPKIARLEADIAEAERDQADDEELTREQQRTTPNSGAVPLAITDAGARRQPAVPGPQTGRAYDHVGRVTSEPHTYDRHSAGEGVSFFRDLWNHSQGGFEGSARLQRHAVEVERDGMLSPNEQSRATTTGSFAGVVPPQYLVDETALVLRNGRPVANTCNRQQIPDAGMTVIIPRGTTGATAASQATENTGVSNTDQVYANLTVPIVTIAGQQDVSRQALDRGIHTDLFIFTDLIAAYAAELDRQVINGTGTNNQFLGMLNTAGIYSATAFGAAPTATNFQLKTAGAINGVASAGTAISPKIVAMHPRRWSWMQSLVDSAGRPLAVATPMGPNNAAAVTTYPGGYSGDGDGFNGAKFVGVMANGLPVLTDANIPTTIGTNSEDIVGIYDNQQCFLWEDGDGMPKQLRFEQTTGGSLTTKLVIYGYAAFTVGRYPQAFAYLGGKDSTATFGLVAPSF